MANVVDLRHGISYVKNNTIYTVKSLNEIDSSAFFGGKLIEYKVADTIQYLELKENPTLSLPTICCCAPNMHGTSEIYKVVPQSINAEFNMVCNGYMCQNLRIDWGSGSSRQISETLYFKVTFDNGSGQTIRVPLGGSYEGSVFPVQPSGTVRIETDLPYFSTYVCDGSYIGSGSGPAPAFTHFYFTVNFITSTPIT